MSTQISYDPRFVKRNHDGVVALNTVGIVMVAHDGFAAADRCRKRNPGRARRLENLAETLISAAAVVLRFEEAMVPIEVAEAITELSDLCRNAR